ncbi:hypothetical protein HYPSUDRAFT_526230 [Hypholoma sublateritium FD-334 SS-4]|uniref:F-box domain-containing protein n=1 Tax=Hypholoma sublateritium (strain FD-334 SS-4) TaxID=945553 RepID=A0A0D2P6T3_HYPSF|nr:hypothetical protein HYPSUDRAFT_526230 [Hypholoma sublateritium FD-334 SS-4]
MTGEPFTRTTPIFKLGDDVLYEIFLANTYQMMSIFPYSYPTPTLNDSPLVLTLRASHVCRAWRDVLLRSSLIWARCIDLDALDQATDHWRDLVLQRAGRSMLCISAQKARQRMVPASGLATFLANLLDKHWAQIEEIDLSIDIKDLRDPRIAEPLGRPAEKLRVFVLRGAEVWSLLGIHLFHSHAPSLVRLVIPGVCPAFRIDLKAPFMFTSNMRHLDLQDRLKIRAVDLLDACIRMPLLETLKLIVAELVVDGDSLPRPAMTNLHLIEINCCTFDIYPVFLDRITSAADCILRVFHKFSCHSHSIRSLDVMQRVLSRYGDSFFAHHQGQPDHFDVGLGVTPARFTFSCYESCQEQFDIWVEEFADSFTVPSDFFFLSPVIVSRLLDTMSTIKFSSGINRLNLKVSLQNPDEDIVDNPQILPQFTPSLIQALSSMQWVTTLAVNFADAPTLKAISALGDLFPALKTLLITRIKWPPQPTYPNFSDNVLPFLAQRHRTAPLQVLNLDQLGNGLWMVQDMRAFEEITGLTIVWKVDGVSRQYVCGSGDAERLFIGPRKLILGVANSRSV